MDVTIAIPTHGDPWWSELATQRALPSAEAQGVPVVHRHYPENSLAEARNRVLNEVTTEFVVYLDADDELEPGFVEHLAGGTADLRAPAVRYVRPGWNIPAARMPKVAGHEHDCTGECLPEGNWLVVGSAVRTELIHSVGWRDFDLYEDWDAWWRCWQAGASIESIPTAVYRAHVRADSRNRAPDRATRLRVHREIAALNT